VNVRAPLFNPGSTERKVTAADLIPVLVRGHRAWLLRGVSLGRRFNHGRASRLSASLETAVPSPSSKRIHPIAQQHIAP
jgi:hypothetical protein